MTGSDNPFRIGLLRLTDAAPLIVAREAGFFAREGLDVELSVEPSWANVADKLAYGVLDGAMLLPPLALALRFGLSGGGGPEPIIVPAALSLNGNTVTLSSRWAKRVLGNNRSLPAAETARRFRAIISECGEKPVLAVVHTFSTHNFLLRYWLAAGGIGPDRDVTFTVVPPAETVDALAAGKIDGFCAGAPWGEVAARSGLGRTVATSHAIWNHGMEKVFAVRQSIVDENPGRLRAALRALLRATAYCDEPANAKAVAAMLAQDAFLGLPAEVIATSLPSANVASSDACKSVFFANAANYPWLSHAQWFLGEMRRWGYVGADVEPKAAAEVFRPDLFADAANSLGLPVPISTVKSEGLHNGAWLLPARPLSIAMGPDCFVDGARFEPGKSRDP